MRDLIRPDASFTPRELFARMQGAWFEPRQGYMWQEHTGVTPTTAGGQTIGKLVDLSADRVASQSTAANRPLLGRRYNLLTYSEDFSNAAWAKTAAGTGIAPAITQNDAIAPDGTLTADRAVFNSGAGTTSSDRSLLNYPPIPATIGSSYTASIYIKGSAGAQLMFRHAGGGTYSLITLTGNWDRISVAENATSTTISWLLEIRQGVLGTINSSATVWLWGADLRLTSNIIQQPIYQRITTATDYDPGPYPALTHNSTGSLSVSLPDLSGGVFSSAGSVYFATPQGMSALHSQSIGTTYTLPAPNSSIYGWCVFPARLPFPLEQRLALYMHRLAGLADADFFWQEDYGPELMTNGDFSNGTTGWLTATFASISAVSGKLRVTNGAAVWGYAYQVIGTTAGKLYQMQVNATLGTALKTEMSAGTDPSSAYNLIDINNPANIPYRFFASSSQTRVALWSGSNVSGQYSDYDNISVREVLDGQVGQLLADDNDTILLRA